MDLVAAVLVLLVAGSSVYAALVIVAARQYLAACRRTQPASTFPPISILKPLSGLDEGLEENLRSYFAQDYPNFEILCAVRNASDPAAAVFEKLRVEYPGVPARLIVTGEPPYANAKVFALDSMLAAARYDLLVMTDSDTRARPDLLRGLAAEFEDPRLGLTTCPYRGIPGRSFWSTLETIGMNTEFIAGILVARMLEGMKFGVGPGMAVRREVLERIGGFDALKDYLAEDFMMGKLAAEAGYGTALSSCVIEHRIGSQRFRPNLQHRLRWARSTRRSRPAGYFGQVFTYPLPLALLLAAVAPEWWPLAVGAVVARAAAAWATAGWVLHDSLTARKWWLLPLQDLASFLLWIAGFFGDTISWRGRRYVIFPDGRFAPVAAGQQAAQARRDAAKSRR
ncbi:MAG TPA: bacteriohopanetetrol glucosamine biosynthesis glycosyltransferase HpnI [Bryobacteraceae bacterium]|nr:bacteriohopanetetrol glucosamine biosynthesis glycosyltransferase HpnI [Bryobacteraceae bacterium]HOQ44120.1 bacteriohopanetetrol glucosamine biosynthesis glycosyltransferase HpnI [Bryobacteraceae bacterium]HPQ15330.1 bacteriohopanetetrol glucosamine biosynthesis glycosyltransferase HpnI [Bryobacteraceae bacterium]HPU70438.1 bacteriohopanetetrol glucosamine biosynthesis glycosyltransferase HpnI [Bryobacteraceae bacterium]